MKDIIKLPVTPNPVQVESKENLLTIKSIDEGEGADKKEVKVPKLN